MTGVSGIGLLGLIGIGMLFRPTGRIRLIRNGRAQTVPNRGDLDGLRRPGDFRHSA